VFVWCIESLTPLRVVKKRLDSILIWKFGVRGERERPKIENVIENWLAIGYGHWKTAGGEPAWWQVVGVVEKQPANKRLRQRTRESWFELAAPQQRPWHKGIAKWNPIACAVIGLIGS